VVSYGPGVAPRNHRTDSVDYVTVISGEIDMEIDGTSVHLKAGDVLVQRGTIHNWVNRGNAPCIIASVLVRPSLSLPAGRCSTPWDEASARRRAPPRSRSRPMTSQGGAIERRSAYAPASKRK
jgi:uncharacterized cupin superfamily protein